MTIFNKLDNWLTKTLWHKSDTPETLEQKVYMVRNIVLASVLISVSLTIMLYFKSFLLFILASPILFVPLVTGVLLILVKRGIRWFQHLYYGGYIIICCILVLILAGLPNSCGAWGGAFIVFMHTLAIKDKQLILVTGFIYGTSLIIIGFLSPSLIPPSGWSPSLNNLLFTVAEIWMCLFLVKSFYDSIVIRTNEAKRRAAHLQELDAIKSKLYANITHEFRTPLTLIRGNAEEIGEQHDGEIAERAKYIVQSSDKILFLVNQMLNLSKIEEGNVPMHYIQCDLIAFVRFIVSSFRGYADMRKIHLHYEPQCALLIMDIETEKLEESISNLLSNAIKYTPEGGYVFVTVRKLTDAKSLEQQVEVRVRDTGVGIHEDQLDKIFIRFYRIEDNQYPYREGTGIGLTLVNEYIKLMQGSVKVNSCQGKGSEFIVTLPVTNRAKIEEIIPLHGENIQKEETNFTETGTIKYISNRPRLLIIEDNQELREYLVRLLENEYQIFTAENGIAGVKRATEQIPDIILSDVMMPGKDGYQVCRELKNDFRTCHIPIVFLTARADTESRINGLEQGADAYLSKPFNKRELLICLHNLLVQRETLRLNYSSVPFDKKVDGAEARLNGKFLDRVKSLLEKNYKNDRYGIQNLYTDMGISRVQLHRKLTALTGLSASNFIRNFRLQKARKLLMETDKNVSDIAFEVGFDDANYFSKSFIHEYGVPATEIRKSFR